MSLRKILGLVDWGITEAYAFQYCYDHGYDFGGLYKLFHRVSCWCCPLQGLSELRNLRKHFPELWAKLLYWETRTWRSFRADYSVDELEIRLVSIDAGLWATMARFPISREGGGALWQAMAALGLSSGQKERLNFGKLSRICWLG